MESLAYLELALVSEAPAESKIGEGLKWKHLSSQTYVGLLSLALMLSVLSAAGSAFAQIDPRNPNLRSVQDRLRDLGYFPRSSTGQLGPVTQQALTNFQRDYQLSLTGRPDRATVIVSLKVSQSLFSNRAELTGGRSGKIAEIPQPVLNRSQIWISRIYLSKSRTGCTQNRQHQSQRQQTDISLTR